MSVADVLAGRAQWAIAQGDVLERLAEMPDASVNCVVTSPPYWGLRDYGVAGQIGLEPMPDAYVARMVAVFAEVRRVLRTDGTCWVNLGDSYASSPKGNPGALSNGLTNQGRNAAKANAHRTVSTIVGGLKPKDLVGIPWRVAFALQADGWWLRSDVIWAKLNPMPESVTDRPTRSHEYLFLLTKSARYAYDADAIREPHADDWYARASTWQDGRAKQQQRGDTYHPFGEAKPFENPPNPAGRNRRTVWTIATEPYPESHFAVFPTALVEPCILAGSPVGGVVLDPFAGSGTTLLVALRHGRRALGIELNGKYVEMASRRIFLDCPMFNAPDGEAAG